MSSGAQPVRIGLRTLRTASLTRTQELIWASQRLHPDAPLANMGTRTRIRGRLDPDRLVQAFDAVVRASDVLRMVVDTSARAGDERIRVLDRPPRPTETVELAVSDLDGWSRERIAQPIDASECVYDSVVLRHAVDDWTWWLDLHHLATDAASSALVYTATARAYEQSAAGDEVDLTRVVVGGFFDVTEALATEPGASDTADERAVEWRTEREAAGPQPPIELYGPLGPRTTLVDRLPIEFDDAQRRRLDEAISGPYRSISRELGLLGLGVMAAAIAVHRLDGRSAVVVGVPVHHRSSKRTRRLVGPLMELYPLTFRVDTAESHVEMFARVLRSVTALLRRAKPGESPDTPFEVVVNVLTARYGDFAGLPATSEWMRSGHVDPTHQIRLQVYDYDGADGQTSMRWELDLNRSASADRAASRLPRHMGQIIDAIITRPDEPIGSRPVVDAEEAAELMALSPRPEPITPTTTVHRAVQRRLRADPDRVVVEHAEATITAADLDRRADRVATWLVRSGLTPGRAVGLRMPRSIDVLVAIHGVLRAGGVFVMLAPDDPAVRHDLIAADADLFTILDVLPAEALDGSPADTAGNDTTLLPDVDLDQGAYILYTSGSTGTPKGVPISHRGLADYLAFAVEAYTDDQPPVVALHSALVFDLTITSLFLAHLSGGRIVVFDQEPITALGEIANDDRITFLKATPSQLELFVRLASAPRLLRTVVVGGEAFRRPVAQRVLDVCAPGVRIFNEYGPTEAVVGCMIHEWSPDDDLGVDVPIGHACPGSEIRILDADGHLAPTGSWGELYVRRPGMAQAYLDPSEASNERFVELDGGGPLWYRTGDRVRVERPGVAVYGGRMDDQLKVNGIRLEPAEVEAALVSLDGIESALVRVWQPADRVGTIVDSQRCVRCGLGVDVPGVELDADGVCNACRTFDTVAPQTERWFRTEADLDERLADARRRRTGDIDCLHLLSGGKDSTYALYQLVERGWKVHALTLDNGFISEGAKENVRRSVADLGITHEFATTDVMKEIFRDSLDRYSNVCQGCYKTIYTIAVARARELGIPVIVTGLSRGQFFETRLVPHQFESGRFDPDEIDQTVLEARRVYHQTPDAVTELLPEQRVFDDMSVLDEIEFLDYYRYVDVDLAELYEFLEHRAPWVRPADTGRSTNCLINVAGISVHQRERGFHNYAEPYSWDVRLGHKTRDEALEELDDEVDDREVARLLAEIGYEPKTNGVLTAWYRTVDGTDRDPAELRHLLRDRLPEHAIPAAFVRVDEMPLAASAKADPSLLPAPLRFHRHGVGAIAPSTPIELRLCEIWCDVLGLDGVGVTDDFFDLGGASLDALEVVAAVDVAYGTDLHDATVFRARTIRELATTVSAALATSPAGRSAADTRRTRNDVIAPVAAPLPLSAGEEAMLFEYRSDPDDTRYNVTRLYRVERAADPMSGADLDFDVDRFADAVRAVVSVHEPLHTSYDAARRALPTDAAVRFTELAPMSGDEFDRFADEQRRVPFDLDNGPLVRVHLSRSGPWEVSILVGLHHISIDAGTFDLLWDQIVESYASDRLPVPAVTYAAHGAWQRTDHDRSRAFWIERARRRTPAGRLAFASPNPAEPDGYLSKPLDVSPAELAAPGHTPFAVAMAATTAVLAKATGSATVEFGITASTKDHPDVDQVVGYHLNTLPMTFEVRAADRFRDLLRSATAQIAETIEHRTYPYADIVRDARTAGLVVPDVSCMLAYEQLAPTTFPGATAEHRILASGTAVADLTFFVQERPDRVQLGLEYRGAVLARSDAARLLDVFATMLLGGTAAPERPVAELMATFLGPDAVGAALDPPSRSVLRQIVEQAATAPDAPAVVDSSGRSLGYDELVCAATLLADRITELAHGPAGRVGVAVRRSTDLVVAMLGSQLAGAAYVPLDPTAPAGRLAAVAAAARLDVLVIDGAGPPIAVDVPTIDVARIDPATVDAGRDELRAGAARRAEAVDLDAVAYVIFTSGSTGSPRGVEVSHRNLAASNDARSIHYARRPQRFLVTSSIGFDSSIVGLVWPLTTGGTVVLPDDDEVRDVDRLGDLVARTGATHLLMVPSLYRAVLDRAADRLTTLAVAIVAGEACPMSLVQRHHELLANVELVNEYGPTEATVWATAHRLSHNDDRVRIGRPIPGTTLRTVDADLTASPEGVAGELLISSPGVVAGYLDGSQSERFVDIDGRRWYRTGDRVRIVDGVAEFVGRTDDQLNVAGVRLEPGEVEVELERLDGIRTAVVVAAGEPPMLVAHLEADSLDEAAVRSALAERLPNTSIPRRFQVHAELPRTPNGKVDRVAAALLPFASTRPSTMRPTGGPAVDTVVVDTVVGVWRDVLDRDDVTADTDFFDIGGDSLAAVSIVVAVGDALGRTIPIAALLTGRTPAGMVATVGGSTSRAAVVGADEFPVVTFQRGTPGGPLVLMTPAWDDVFGYRDLAQTFPSDVTVAALAYIEQPGRPVVTTIDAVADAFVPLARDLAAGHSTVGVVGWSVGGVVAAELANRLVAGGQDVTVVAMVDTFFPGEERHLWSNRWWKYKSMLRPGGVPEIGRELQLMVGRRVRRLAAHVGRRLLTFSGSVVPEEPPRTSVGHFPVESLGHPIASVDVPLVLYRASTTNPLRTIDKWRRLSPDLDDVVVRGRHRGLDSIMGSDRVGLIGRDLCERLRS
jgi:amino acid adenylation domain-containing protein